MSEDMGYYWGKIEANDVLAAIENRPESFPTPRGDGNV
jgi:hypothetical protein